MWTSLVLKKTMEAPRCAVCLSLGVGESPPFKGLSFRRGIKAVSSLSSCFRLMFFFSCVVIVLDSCFLVNFCASPGLPHRRPPRHCFLATGRGPKAVERQPEGDAARGSALEKDSLLEAPPVLTKQGPLFQTTTKFLFWPWVPAERLPREVPKCLFWSPNSTPHSDGYGCPALSPLRTTACGGSP